MCQLFRYPGREVFEKELLAIFREIFEVLRIKVWSNEDESRLELRSESLHKSSLNSHAPVKRGES